MLIIYKYFIKLICVIYNIHQVRLNYLLIYFIKIKIGIWDLIFKI